MVFGDLQLMGAEHFKVFMRCRNNDRRADSASGTLQIEATTRAVTDPKPRQIHRQPRHLRRID